MPTATSMRRASRINKPGDQRAQGLGRSEQPRRGDELLQARRCPPACEKTLVLFENSRTIGERLTKLDSSNAVWKAISTGVNGKITERKQ